MRRIPRACRSVVAQALAVDMADHGRALGAARPVLAGAILRGWECAALRRRAGQHVMTVRCEADTGNDEAAFSHRVIEAELVVVAVQIIDARRNDRALEILPRAVADAVARVDRRLAGGLLSAEIGAPGLAPRAVARRQGLAMRVGAFEAADVGALAGSGARDEERHVRCLGQLRWCRRLLLCVDAGRDAQRQCGNDQYLGFAHLVVASLWIELSRTAGWELSC